MGKRARLRLQCRQPRGSVLTSQAPEGFFSTVGALPCIASVTLHPEGERLIWHTILAVVLEEAMGLGPDKVLVLPSARRN